MAKILKCHKTLLIYLLSDSIFLIPPIQSRTTYTDTIKCQCRHKPAWHRDISATGEGVGFRNAKPNHSESSDTELLIPPLWAGPGIKVSWHMGRSKQPLCCSAHNRAQAWKPSLLAPFLLTECVYDVAQEMLAESEVCLQRPAVLAGWDAGQQGSLLTSLPLGWGGSGSTKEP